MTQQAVEWQPVWAHAALEAAHSHGPLLATELQLSYEKWVNFNWDCLRVWSEVSNVGRSIPKRPSHPFGPLKLYNMPWEVGLVGFRHTKQVLTHSSVLGGIYKLQDFCTKTERGAQTTPPAQAPPAIVSAYNECHTPSGDWDSWVVMDNNGNSRFQLISLIYSKSYSQWIWDKRNTRKKSCLKNRNLKKWFFLKTPESKIFAYQLDFAFIVVAALICHLDYIWN